MRTAAWPLLVVQLSPAFVPAQPQTWPEERTVRHRIADDEAAGIAPDEIAALLAASVQRSVAGSLQPGGRTGGHATYRA
jgi:hypothetical protein